AIIHRSGPKDTEKAKEANSGAGAKAGLKGEEKAKYKTPPANAKTPGGAKGTPVTLESLNAQIESLRAMTQEHEVRMLSITQEKPQASAEEEIQVKALLDSGATHAVVPFRREMKDLERVGVTLAGDLREVSWCKKRGLRVTHSRLGPLKAMEAELRQMSSPCDPTEVPEAVKVRLCEDLPGVSLEGDPLRLWSQERGLEYLGVDIRGKGGRIAAVLSSPPHRTWTSVECNHDGRSTEDPWAAHSQDASVLKEIASTSPVSGSAPGVRLGLGLDEVEPELLESLFQELDLDSMKAVEAEIRDATTGIELVTLRYFVGLKSKTGADVQPPMIQEEDEFLGEQPLQEEGKALDELHLQEESGDPPGLDFEPSTPDRQRLLLQIAGDVYCITNEVRAFDPRGYHAVRKNPDWVIVGLGFRIPIRFEEEHQIKVVRQQQEPERELAETNLQATHFRETFSCSYGNGTLNIYSQNCNGWELKNLRI
ncbi:unnamed protein product, partial [Symbiodinium necroappetens]